MGCEAPPVASGRCPLEIQLCIRSLPPRGPQIASHGNVDGSPPRPTRLALGSLPRWFRNFRYSQCSTRQNNGRSYIISYYCRFISYSWSNTPWRKMLTLIFLGYADLNSVSFLYGRYAFQLIEGYHCNHCSQNPSQWKIVTFSFPLTCLIRMIRGYNKNSYPLRNRILPNKVTIGAQEPRDHRPSGSWGPNWELCDFSMGMGSCFYPMYHRSEGHWLLGNHTFPNTPFLHRFWHWSWDENE